MRDNEYELRILYTLREGQARTPIAELFPDGKIPPHTGGGLFGEALIGLIDTEFVELFDGHGNNITAEVKSLGDPSDRTLSRGYKVAHFLMGREDEVHAILTERLSEIQSVLGFSVTQQ